LKGGQRWFLGGYRYGESKQDPLKEIKADAHITVPRKVALSMRPTVGVSLGCHVVGAACPHPDPHDPDTTIAGFKVFPVGVASGAQAKSPWASQDASGRASEGL